MKRALQILLLFAVFALAGCREPQHRIIILSTNDIHAQIQNFPKLASAVLDCRDTAEVVLVDLGDRWTGNAYVDLAEGRRPILALMNKLGYDVATLGNHEFDVGQTALQAAIDYGKFTVICANFQSDSGILKTLPPTLFLERNGIKFAFVGVVTNYGSNNHPDGQDEIFQGLTFTDAVHTAAGYQKLADQCDVLVAMTHIGTEKDRELADEAPAYDLILGGHSHEVINEVKNGVQITQTGKNLANIGVTEIVMRGSKVESISYRNVSLADYPAEPNYQAMVDDYYANPALQVTVGELSESADKMGITNMFTRALRDFSGSDIGIYHIGGVRLDTMSQGAIPLARIYDLDPFGSTVCTMDMTVAQIRHMIMEKYNDTVNVGESHGLNLYATTPYKIVTKAGGKTDAVNVLFPQLKEGRTYKVAIGDYVFKNYKGLEYTNGKNTDLLVTDALKSLIGNDGQPFAPDNTKIQSIQ
ncbi:MAG: 5'-nucleotidase C-terminal domain-containing protein [Alistipes sp.]